MYLTSKDLEGLTPAQKRKASKIAREQGAILDPARSARMKRYDDVRKETYKELGIKEKREEVSALYRPQIRALEQKVREIHEEIAKLEKEAEEADDRVCSVWYEAQSKDPVYLALCEIERGVREKGEAILKAYLDECKAQEPVTA